MAEARQAVAFQFAVTEEGIQVHFDKDAVKSAIKALLGFTKSRYLRMTNALLKGLFPASPWSLLVIGVLVACVFSIELDSSLRVILDWSKWFDFPDKCLTLVVLCCETVCLWVVSSYIQRYILKSLLCYKGWMFDPHGKRSFPTKMWIVAVKGITLFTRPQLYSYQASLPRLPVPKLEKTCQRYLESVRALLNDEEFHEREQLIKDFQNGLGKKLQRYLILKSWWSNNYVTDWWETYVYLYGRSPIMINSNYYACDMINNPHVTTNPAARAAMISYSMIKIKRDIERGKLKPLLVMGLIPLCSAQYERVFGTTRIPGEATDKLVHYKGAESDYFVCYRRGRWFKVPLTSPRGKIYSSAELEHQMQYVLDYEDGMVGPGEEHLAALTTLNRTEWAKARQTYFMDGVNRVSMEIIEKAAYIVMFDDHQPILTQPDHLSDYCKYLLHGSGHSIWFDKSFTVIIFANGKLGTNAEHSWADAPIIGYMIEHACNTESITGYQDGHCPGFTELKVCPPPPQRLTWDIPREGVAQIELARTLALEQISDLDLCVLNHNEFGKGIMKKCKISPDAFIQMALQMAYYKDTGGFCLTYEASMTRLYLEGRTETVRPVTTKCTEFARAMCDPNTKTVEEKKKLLTEATDLHTHSYKLAMTGKGIDRHLFCLYVVSKYLKMDSPFLSKVLNEPWKLSTSQTPPQQTRKFDYNKNPEKVGGGGGFGPVTKDGYGVSYIIQGDNVIVFHVSAFKSSPGTDARRFTGHIKDSLREIKDLYQI